MQLYVLVLVETTRGHLRVEGNVRTHFINEIDVSQGIKDELLTPLLDTSSPRMGVFAGMGVSIDSRLYYNYNNY